MQKKKKKPFADYCMNNLHMQQTDHLMEQKATKTLPSCTSHQVFQHLLRMDVQTGVKCTPKLPSQPAGTDEEQPPASSQPRMGELSSQHRVSLPRQTQGKGAAALRTATTSLLHQQEAKEKTGKCSCFCGEPLILLQPPFWYLFPSQAQHLSA